MQRCLRNSVSRRNRSVVQYSIECIVFPYYSFIGWPGTRKRVEVRRTDGPERGCPLGTDRPTDGWRMMMRWRQWFLLLFPFSICRSLESSRVESSFQSQWQSSTLGSWHIAAHGNSNSRQKKNNKYCTALQTLLFLFSCVLFLAIAASFEMTQLPSHPIAVSVLFHNFFLLLSSLLPRLLRSCRVLLMTEDVGGASGWSNSKMLLPRHRRRLTWFKTRRTHRRPRRRRRFFNYNLMMRCEMKRNL